MAGFDTGAIVPAFRHALERHGWSALTLTAIADESGVSRMTLHRHEVSRESLLRQLADQLAQEHRETVWPIIMSARPAAERLQMLVEHELALTEANSALLEALDDAAHAVIYHDESRTGSRTTYIDPYVRILRDGMHDGSFSGIEDPGELATVLFTMIGPTYRHLRRHHGWSIEKCRSYLLRYATVGVIECVGPE